MLSFRSVSVQNNNDRAELPRPPHDSPPLPLGSVNPAAVLSTPADQKNKVRRRTAAEAEVSLEAGSGEEAESITAWLT